MLTVTDEVKTFIKSMVYSSVVERGFLLGCRESIHVIDTVSIASLKEADADYLIIDADLTNTIIRKWAEEDILFCGFLHSHIGGCSEFSAEDKRFADMLVSSFELPFIWFGLAVSNCGKWYLRLKKLFKRAEDYDSTQDFLIAL